MLSLVIKCSNSDKKTIEVENAQITVRELKEAIVAQTSFSTNVADQRLVYKGKVMKDDILLEIYGISANDTIYFVKTAAAAGSAPSPSPSTTTTANPLAVGSNPWGGVGVGGGVPPVGTTNTAASPFGNLFGSGGGIPGMPNMADMQRQLQENPEMMTSLMNSPMIESLLNDPAMMQQMMQSNPQMQAMMESNPQMREVMQNPQVIRQAMEMMRNPMAMQEAMRQQDIQMSNIENTPGGFNALARMYQEVQEPMMDAQDTAAAEASRTTSTPLEARGSRPSNTAIPNPWATPPAPTGGTGMGGGFPGMGVGGGFPGMGGVGGMPNLSQMAQMVQNPQMQQMMQTITSNPAMLDMMAASDPQLRTFLENPQMRAMLSNPALMQQMMNPETWNAMSHVQSVAGMMGGMGGMGGGGGFGQPITGRPAPAPAPLPAGLQGVDFSQFLGGNGNGRNRAAPAPAPSPAAPLADPAVTYASQIQQLRDMGFSDQPAMIRALIATQGNVNAAVERLLG